ncbi:hypothetical protein [Kribbella ginsengisoli]|uniref:TfoX N-terminal domain-containing protein n=1 Tax=Kribbella ginsengisoli TaxID=363865 RepID=A0ABP6XCF6_9ACTN
MKPKISLQTRLEYDAVAKGLADEGVVEGSMFGMPCLKIEKKMLAGLFGDAMTFKLPPGPREEALKLTGAEAFDPGMGRPMKEWVVIPLEHAATWPKYAEQALAFVRP